MTKIAFFINSTIDKKKLDINNHNINILFNIFDEIYVCDENNDIVNKLKCCDSNTKEFSLEGLVKICSGSLFFKRKNGLLLVTIKLFFLLKTNNIES